MFSSSILDTDQIKRASSKYPKDPSITYQYGTAGFRYKNEILDSVLLRVGILAVLRSKALKGQTIGVMITASHNQESDNGVKIVDPMGEMMDSEWEAYATELANVPTDQVSACCSRLFNKLKIDFSQNSSVIFARDTRPSGPRLVRALNDGIACVGGSAKDFGELSTPQLHYLVRCLNTANTENSYGVPTESGYFQKLAKAFTVITGGFEKLSALSVDCANGVGALKLREFINVVGKDNININVVNADIRTAGKLNFKCGADFVKVDQKTPDGITPELAVGRCASYDGDADRLVYFFVDQTGTFKLLDGDKIAALAASFIKDQLKNIPALATVEVGVVQTAYANGASTKYFEKQGIPVAFTETGVKHLHHRAEQFDIGVYFEANGHGTVVFSPKFKKQLVAVKKSELAELQVKSFETLSALIDLVNETVGDALSDMQMVEAALTQKKWTLIDWATNLYQDLPNRQLKVKVADRNSFKTTDADRVLVSPVGLQQVIDAWVQKYDSGRAFVRPSGTEDVVRIYAEAATQELCDELAYGLAKEVYTRAGGVGECPTRK